MITISVPSLWNFSQSSFPSRVTLGSSTTPSSSGGGMRAGWGPASGWWGASGCGDACNIPGGRWGLSGLIAGPPGAPWWWWCNAAAAAARTAASSGVCGPKPKPETTIPGFFSQFYNIIGITLFSKSKNYYKYRSFIFIKSYEIGGVSDYIIGVVFKVRLFYMKVFTSSFPINFFWS